MARMLKEQDYIDCAKDLGVEVKAIKAVAEVESRNSGFIGNKPVILFERHVMYRELVRVKGRDYANSESKTNPNLVNIVPGGYGRLSEQHDRLDKAISIDKTCALKSASWGKFQIMGFNYELAGYKSLEGFVSDMGVSESKQLQAFSNFIMSNSALHKSLRNKDWVTFARIYNGPNYAANRYDEKMRRAYMKM